MIRLLKLGVVSLSLSLMTAACYKSSAPVVFPDREISSVEGTILGYTLGKVSSETGEIYRAYQLRDEADGIYLYICSSASDDGESAQPERARAQVSAIPNQEGFAVVSLEAGDVFFNETNPGHEFFVVQPLRDRMLLSVLEGDRSDRDTAYRYFRNVQATATSGNSRTYPVEAIQEFLVEYLDDWWPEEESSAYRYFNGDLTSCSFGG